MAQKILIADDSAMSRSVLNDLFKETAFEIIQAENGTQAIEKVKGDNPDCLILDYQMPDLDGFEVCKKIREQEEYEDLPIIMITAMESPEVKTMAFDAGVTDFFTKNTADEYLVKYVDTLLKNYAQKIDEGKILVVENSNLIRKSICSYLKSANIGSIGVDSGAAALEALENETIDMVISSLVLSDMAEGEIIQRVRSIEKCASLPIIIVSSTDAKADITNAFLEGASDYIIKPFQRDELLARVYSHLKLCHSQKDLKKKNEKLELEVVQRKTAEESLIKQKQSLEKVNKELNSFAYSISHDLRAPLRTVLGYVNLLKEGSENQLTEESGQYLAAIIKNGEIMDNMMQNILAYSQIGRTEEKMEILDMEAIIDDVLSLISSDIEKKNAIVQKEGLIPQCFGYRDRVSQVFLNLIGNSLKYIQPGRQAKIIVGCQQRDNNDWFFVKDNGIGIKKDFFDKIFYLFSRLHDDASEYKGLGVGLSTVKKIVEIHGGKIELESEEGAGATFYFTLQETKKQKSAPEVKQTDSVNNQILIIDDREDDRLMIRKHLEKLGYGDIAEAKSGEEGVEYCEKNNPYLIIVDTKMSGIDGFETCKRIRQLKGQDLRIIMVTGAIDAIDASKARESGADEYSVKTSDYEVMMDAVKKILDDS